VIVLWVGEMDSRERLVQENYSRKQPRTKHSAFFHGDERPYLSGPGKVLDKGIDWLAKIEIHNGKKGN